MGLRTLIGICVEFQCGPYLRAIEAPVLQEASLPGALRIVPRQLGPEAFGANGANGGEPIDLGGRETVVSGGVDDAALRELGADARRPYAARNARSHEAIREAGVGERTGALQLVEHRL